MSDQPLRESIFHQLINRRGRAVLAVLKKVLPLEGMEERNTELFREKVPDKAYQSRDWDNDPRFVFVDFTIDVDAEDIYKMHVYRAWGVEQVARKLPAERKLTEEAETRVLGVLFPVFSPTKKLLSLASRYGIQILSLEEGVHFDLQPTEFTTVGSPLVLAEINWLRLIGDPRWFQYYREALHRFKDDELETEFLIVFGEATLRGTTLGDAHLKEQIESLIREVFQMSSAQALKKILMRWDLPQEEKLLISYALEGLDPEQRQIVMATLKGLTPEQRRQIILAALGNSNEDMKKLFIKALSASPEKIKAALEVLDSEGESS